MASCSSVVAGALLFHKVVAIVLACMRRLHGWRGGVISLTAFSSMSSALVCFDEMLYVE